MSSTPQQQPTPAARVGQATRVFAAVVVVAAGGLFVVGFGLGLLFERDSFGVPGTGRRGLGASPDTPPGWPPRWPFPS